MANIIPITQAGGSGERKPLLWTWNPSWDWDWLIPARDHSNDVQVISRDQRDADGS